MIPSEELMDNIRHHTKKVWCAVQKFRDGTMSCRETWEVDSHHLLLKYYLTLDENLLDSSEVWFAREALEAYEQFRKQKIVA